MNALIKFLQQAGTIPYGTEAMDGCPHCGSENYFSPKPREAKRYNFKTRQFFTELHYYSFCRDCRQTFDRQ